LQVFKIENPFGRRSPEIIRLAVMMYVLFPMPLRTVEDLPHERSIAISHYEKARLYCRCVAAEH